jgi:hypothetical protein
MEDFEMPTPCQKCGEWFDLHDGVHSHIWFPNTVICQECGTKEDEEIARYEEIKDLKRQIDDAEITIKDARSRLVELGVKIHTKIELSTAKQLILNLRSMNDIRILIESYEGIIDDGNWASSGSECHLKNRNHVKQKIDNLKETLAFLES